MKLSGIGIRYNPKETARTRWAAIMEGESLREAAKLRWYTVTTEDARFGQYRLTRGLLGVIKMYLVLGFRYLSCRLKQGPLTGKEKLCQ